ncbi:Uncharacterized protein TCM_036965 [Theobroma cacao]|uniref:Uncharacterized protein n=1 Tax=Theobroma cacao TaxID=3641 RepID=A0A061GIP7_THECC|nr:Uncharacterized protein TCM_036965 [Theobroma cacao]
MGKPKSPRNRSRKRMEPNKPIGSCQSSTIRSSPVITTIEEAISCHHYQSLTNLRKIVDPNILEKQGDNCLLIKGNSLRGFSTVSFAYAWDPPFLLSPAGSIIEPC